MKWGWVWLFLGVGFLMSGLVWARSVGAKIELNVSGIPTLVEKEEEFEIQVTLEGASAGNVYYLRGALSHPDTPTSYFGYTFNGGDWYNGKPSPIDHTKFLRILISGDGLWSGKVRMKADLAASGFKGSGDYRLKVGRYTEGGSLSWSDDEAVILEAPSPTPTPTETPTATKSPTPTKTPTPTKAVSSGSRVTETPVVKLAAATLGVGGPSLAVETEGEVAGISAVMPTPSGSADELTKEGGDLATDSGRWVGVLPKVMVVVGIGLLAAAAYPAVKVWREKQMANGGEGEEVE